MYLRELLEEMNRRIRRRMVTRGDVSLDVEDNRGPYDWPQLSELSADVLQYSVHLPLEPKQNSRWPGGSPSQSETVADAGVVRVLNIVVDEARILSSRERCPFLVHVEVAETGLRGSDSRLYATGAPGLGATVGEALAMTASQIGDRESNGRTYEIPNELLDSTNLPRSEIAHAKDSADVRLADGNTGEPNATGTEYIRGGYQQGDENAYYAHNPDDVWNSNAWEDVRQGEYEQLHQQMYVQREAQQQQQYHPQHQLGYQR